MRRVIELIIYPKVGPMRTSFGQSFSSRALCNEKLQKKLYFDVEHPYPAPWVHKIWKIQKNPCFLDMKFFLGTRSLGNSTGSRFLTLSEWLEACFASKMSILYGFGYVPSLYIRYSYKIWPYKKPHISGLRWALALKFFTKVVHVISALGWSFSSRALRNQKLQQFLCLRKKSWICITLRENPCFFQKNPYFWGMEIFSGTIPSGNSTKNSFLVL